MLASTYNQELVQGLQPVIAQYGLSVEIVDVFTLNNTIIANPSAYGFTNVTTPVWTGSFNNSTSGTLNATGAAQNLYFFFDGEHCTAPGHQDIANLALSNLP
jgi:outer membrane lipase/esterase